MFDLGETSRLPSWYSIPSGLTRQDIHVSMTFYTNGDVKFVIRGPSGILAHEIGKHEWHPLTLKEGLVKKPSYSIITVHGISDVYEQRAPEPFLYITDDPQLTKLLHSAN
jgi:hypothetical protein